MGSNSIVITIIVLVCSVAILYFCRRRILLGISRFLISSDPEHNQIDAIVLLNGNISTRPFCAAQLYKNHRAPILIARLADTQEMAMEVIMGAIPNISEATVKLLIKLNVAPEDICIVDSKHWIAGTWGEATLLSESIREKNYRNITIVSDAFHTRRARWTFRKVMSNDNVDFRCIGTPFSKYTVDQWWRSEYGLIQVVVEYLKFIHYRVKYAIK